MNNQNNFPISTTCFKRCSQPAPYRSLVTHGTLSKRLFKASLRRREAKKDVTYRYSYEKNDQPFSHLFEKNAVIKAFLLSVKPLTQQNIYRDLNLTREYLPFFFEQIHMLKEETYIRGEGTYAEPWSIIDIDRLRRLYDKRVYPYAARNNLRPEVSIDILRLRAELEPLKLKYSAKGRRLLKKMQESQQHPNETETKET